MSTQLQIDTTTESAPQAWTPRPWTLSRSGGVEAKFVLVTPEMAQEVLLHQNTQNRRQSMPLAKKYRAKMQTQRWHLTNQGIGFFRGGRLADGQHRLAAIVTSGIAQTILVVTGIDPDAAMAIDDVRARSEADRLRISGLEDESLVARSAVVRALSEMSLSFDRGRTLLTEEVAEVMELIRDDLDFVISSMPRKTRGMSHSCARAAVLTALLNGADRDRVARFCELVKSGTGATKAEGAAIRLRDYLMGPHTSSGSAIRKDIYLRSQRALKAFLDGHGITKLFAPPEPIWSCDALFPSRTTSEETSA